MARKKRHEEHENHERWLVSYADFITLLFAFFVVMYSLSSVNEGKYRILAESLVAAFRSPTKSLEPIQVGKLARSPMEAPLEIRKQPVAVDLDILSRSSPGDDGNSRGPTDGDIQRIAEEIERALQGLIDAGSVTVRSNKLGVEVEINTSILYPSGSSQLAPAAAPVIDDLAEILKPFPNRIRVRGYTDNVPISTRAFPSNWELSAARAATVVRLFASSGVRPERMAAIGLGEYHPVADNATLAGRRRNRRVVLAVLAEDKSAPGAHEPARLASEVSSRRTDGDSRTMSAGTRKTR